MAKGKRGGPNTKFSGKAFCGKCGKLYAVIIPATAGVNGEAILRKHSPCGLVTEFEPVTKFGPAVLKRLIAAHDDGTDKSVTIALPLASWKQAVGLK